MSHPGAPPVPPRPAHWRSRAVASIVDSAVQGLIPFVLWMVALAASDTTVDDAGAEVAVPSTASLQLLVLAAAVLLVTWAVNRGVLQGRGRSLGKRVVHTVLIDVGTGRPVGTARALLRDIAHLLDAPFWIGYLWPLWDAQRQTFADKLTGTVVVDG